MAKESKKALIISINPDTIKAIEKCAADDFRSVNGQIEFLLNEALKKSGRYDKNDNDIIDGETGKRFDD